MKKRLISVICVVLLLVLLPMQSVEAKAKPKLSAKSKTLTVGQTYTIKLKNVSTKAKVKWTTNKKSVVSISKKSGSKVVVKAKKSGTATITAKYKGKTYRCKITVKKKKTDKKEVVEKPVMNATSVDLYYYKDEYKQWIGQNSTHLSEYRFKVTGTKQEVKKWELIGEDKDYFEITDYGKVTIFWAVTYEDKIKSATVKATLEDGTIVTAKVNQYNEINTYIDSLFDTFASTYITSDMTDKEKAEKVAWYIGTISDYKLYNDYWRDIFLCGTGDCMASRVAVEALCRYIGVKAWACTNLEYHGKTLIRSDEKYYMIITGYDAPRPRPYTIYEVSDTELNTILKDNPIDLNR